MPIDSLRVPSTAPTDARLATRAEARSMASPSSSAPASEPAGEPAATRSPAPLASHEVVVSGCVKRRHSFDLCALKRLPTQLTGALDVVCLSGRKVRSASDYKGVRLSA